MLFLKMWDYSKNIGEVIVSIARRRFSFDVIRPANHIAKKSNNFVFIN